jgi:hypothetical protein
MPAIAAPITLSPGVGNFAASDATFMIHPFSRIAGSSNLQQYSELNSQCEMIDDI